MKRKTILKDAGVLLIASLMVLTAIVVTANPRNIINTGTSLSNGPNFDKLLPLDGAAGDSFGFSLAYSYDPKVSPESNLCLLAGAPYDDDKGIESGAVYVFGYNETNNTWHQQTKLTASDGTAGDYFGYSISINGSYAIIGAPGDDDKASSAGAAYIFRYNKTSQTWQQQAKLIAADGASQDSFGYSVSITSDIYGISYAVITAPYDDNKGESSGSAYIFRYDPATTLWQQRTKIVPDDGAADDIFGLVSIWDTTDFAKGSYVRYCLFSAPQDNDKGANSGSVYVFEYNLTSNTCSQQAKITASDGAAGDGFGYSIDWWGCFVLPDVYGVTIGAPFDDDKGNDSGSAYIFTYNTTSKKCTQQAKLTASDGQAFDMFGYSAAFTMTPDGIPYPFDLIIGAPGDDDKGNDSGSAYIFTAKPQNGSYQQLAKITTPDGQASDHTFIRITDLLPAGSPLNLDPCKPFCAGAPGDDDKGSDSGSVYVLINHPPETPIITGRSTGQPGTPYEYHLSDLDNDGDYDLLYYDIDWGDETTDWLGPYASGEEVKVTHAWSEKGTYDVKVEAYDSFGAESDWATLTVTMPYSYQPLHQFLELLVQRFPNTFPLLRQLMGY
jgi:hypothetical protein